MLTEIVLVGIWENLYLGLHSIIMDFTSFFVVCYKNSQSQQFFILQDLWPLYCHIQSPEVVWKVYKQQKSQII